MPNRLPDEPKAHLGEEKSSPIVRKTSNEALGKIRKVISEASEIKERYENLSRSGETTGNLSKLSLS